MSFYADSFVAKKYFHMSLQGIQKQRAKQHGCFIHWNVSISRFVLDELPLVLIKTLQWAIPEKLCTPLIEELKITPIFFWNSKN